MGTEMYKFGIKIRTKNGLLVEKLIVHARDKTEAEEKIKKVYMHCEIIECREQGASGSKDNPELDNIFSLISKEQTRDQKE